MSKTLTKNNSDKWFSPGSLKEEIKRRWDSGSLLVSILKDEEPVLVLTRKIPTRTDLSTNPFAVNDWLENMKKNFPLLFNDNQKVFSLSEVKTNGFGTQQFCKKIQLNKENILYILGRERFAPYLYNILNTVSLIEKFDSRLLQWIYDSPKEFLSNADKWICFQNILTWLKNHDRSTRNEIYLRQANIPEVDTKFIENNEKVLKKLVSICFQLMEQQENVQDIHWLGFKSKHKSYIRFRVLDPLFTLNGFDCNDDITISTDAFNRVVSRFLKKMIVVENEISFLSLPLMKETVAVFGSGMAAGETLGSTVSFCQNCKEIWYWGDIDYSGFNILANLRKKLSEKGISVNVKSIMMDTEVLNLYPDLCVQDASDILDVSEEPEWIALLTDKEQATFSAIRKLSDINQENDKNTRRGIRLEQEKIPIAYTNDEFKKNGLIIIG